MDQDVAGWINRTIRNARLYLIGSTLLRFKFAFTLNYIMLV